MRDYQYYKERLKGLAYPYAVLDVPLFYKNVQTNMKRAGDKKIRIASKSLRCVHTMKMILDYNAQFKGVMAYHGEEALYLAKEGFDDILMGYPIVSKPLLMAIGKAVKEGSQICMMVDSSVHLQLINEVGRQLKTPMPACIDIDLSDNYPGLRFGVWRSGIANLTDLELLLQQVKKSEYVQLEGVMGYEAQVAGVGDKLAGNGVKNVIIRNLKKQSIKRLRKRREAAIQLIRAEGFQLRFVNGGGTGSLETTSREAVVTEVTVGSGFYNAHLFDNYQSFQLAPALFYAIPVTRKPKPDVYTCHGGGFIASGAIEKTKAPVVHLPLNGSLDKHEGAGEVQTPVRFKKLEFDLQLGDPVFMRHAKSGELCERFNTIHLLDEESITAVNTYRGGQCSFG